MATMFRSLSGFNYRIWFAGALVSNVGTWMQRTAQDWIVLTELTQHDAVAVGIVTSLQLGPQLLLVPWSGLLADRFDRRKLLMATQGAMGALGAALGIIVLTGVVELWHVYVFALLLGIAAAIDAPARQSFVADLVGDDQLSNAVALNSASFNSARLIGPAVAGVLTVAVGAGLVFIINAVSFLAVLCSLALMRKRELRPRTRLPRKPGQLLDGFRYIGKRPDILLVLVIVFIIGTFGLNFPIFTSTMAVEFGAGAGEFGLLSSILAIGSVVGALLAARRERPRLRLVILAAGAFGLACVIAAVMPTFWTFAASLVLVGFSSITLMTTANGTVQTTIDPGMRGRVMAVYMAIFVGGTPLGAPLVGWVANAWGPRWALGVGGLAGFTALAIGVVWLARHRRLRFEHVGGSRIRFSLVHDETAALPIIAPAQAAEDVEAEEAAVQRS
ncbi:MFS transporter [Compostimonas suwonensis]|uniref:Putative MFS family arabinose efflux permease n=1 Tax=Compostimonas suwonensis TaxID=1048394 RepID=A0A2M9C3M3_9MICO|nr:MFS transporter [Compostimonas suwonensis]PJJ65133.1 putative MFS family arabinose efflux permease [Compostimonas suwonensis]